MKKVLIITDLKPDILKKNATVLVVDEVKKNLKKILRLRTNFLVKFDSIHMTYPSFVIGRYGNLCFFF